jgi:hypothetical protein
MRRPWRQHECLVSERNALENRIENMLCQHGVVGLRPRLTKTAERLGEQCCLDRFVAAKTDSSK